MTEKQTVEKARQHSYGQILKSSALIGGSSVVNVGIGIIRNKAMAVLLGPAGFGLLGLYGSILDLAAAVASMGIGSSAVRQIAEAISTGEQMRVARTVTVLRRISILLGILGALLLVVLSAPVSILTFGSTAHTVAVASLSLAVLFRLMAAGQGALLQGMRRISDLAKLSVLGTLFGTCVSILLVLFFREQGIVPSLLMIAAMSIVTSWWYSRKVAVQSIPMTMSQVARETGSLLKLGVAFMLSAMLMLGSGYAVRAMVVRTVGIEGAGLYQAAWTIGGLYVGFILQAMGTDFYPRLTAVANNNAECNRLVNEQMLIGLLMAGPGVLATLTLAPLVTTLFYSAKFNAAEHIIRWFCLGMTLRVITWPMGFIVLAKGRSRAFLSVDAAWTAVNLGLSWLCISSLGLSGAGIAFFASYVFHGLISYPIVRWLSGFRWSRENRNTCLLFLSAIGVVFLSFYLVPPILATSIGLLATLAIGLYSIRVLCHLVPLHRIPAWVQTLLRRYGLGSLISRETR